LSRSGGAEGAGKRIKGYCEESELVCSLRGAEGIKLLQKKRRKEVNAVQSPVISVLFKNLKGKRGLWFLRYFHDIPSSYSRVQLLKISIKMAKGRGYRPIWNW